jgi:hypothetical protein
MQSRDDLQRRWELEQARDAAWSLVDRLETIGASLERQRVVRIAKRLSNDLRSLEALSRE